LNIFIQYNEVILLSEYTASMNAYVHAPKPMNNNINRISIQDT
jgi:hypothetical protein